MKIVQALGWYFPESLGGTEIYVSGLSRKLRAAGHEVIIAAPDPTAKTERHYEHDGFNVYRYPIPAAPTRAECQGLVPVRGAEKLHAWLKELKADVFHAHTYVTGLGLFELKAAKSTGARVIATTHSSSLGFICQQGTLMRWGEKLCDGVSSPLKCAQCMLYRNGLPKPLAWILGVIPPALSNKAMVLPGKAGTALGMSSIVAKNIARQRDMLATVDKFVLLTRYAYDVVAANGAPLTKISLNRLGISEENFNRKPGPEEMPTSYPLTIGYLGRFESIKGIHDLARAVSSLPPELPFQVEFRGPLKSEDEQRIVHELRALAGEDQRFTFALPVDAKDVCKVLAGYDLLCCPSICLEGGPTVAMEAYSVGTPVIGSRIGGLAELVTDGENGGLVEPGDWRALADLLRKIILDPTGTIDRWRKALPQIRTIDDVAADYLKLYKEGI